MTPRDPPPAGADTAGVPPRLQDDELITWSGLATLLEWLPPLLDAQLRASSGITHFEFGLLYALERATGRTLRLSVLAGYANSSLTRLSRAVDRLERRSWVRRSVDPGDGRYTLATLTDAGHDAVELAEPGHAAIVRQLVLEPLTATQRRQLHAITQRLLSTSSPGRPWRPPAGDAQGPAGDPGDSRAAP